MMFAEFLSGQLDNWRLLDVRGYRRIFAANVTNSIVDTIHGAIRHDRRAAVRYLSGFSWLMCREGHAAEAVLV